MIRTGARGMLSGFGAVQAESVTTSGNIRGAILEWTNDHATEPGVRSAARPTVGIGSSAANTLSLSGGGNYAFVTVGQLRTASSSTEFTALGHFETRLTERRSWRATVTVAAATQIPVSGAMRIPVDPSGGAVTSTAATLFSGSPADGDEVTLININASNAYTLNTHGNAGVNSGLTLGATTRALRAGGGYLHLRYYASTSRFLEIGFG